VRVRLAELTPAIIEDWWRIARDPREKTADRLRAGENIVFSSIGKPAQRIDASLVTAELRPISVVSATGRELRVIDVPADD
jgi:hypothetical protein